MVLLPAALIVAAAVVAAVALFRVIGVRRAILLLLLGALGCLALQLHRALGLRGWG